MGLRCLIGHDYGAPQTSRDTRERGNEVVVTVREYRECARCGHQRVVSENKEITAGPTAEPASDPDEGDDPAGAAGATHRDEAATGTGSTAGYGSPATGPSRATGRREELTAEEDDGVILEDEPEPSTRGHGEWPEDDRPRADEAAPADEGAHEPWPDRSAADEGHDAEPTGDDAAPGVEFGGSLAPEEIDATAEAPAGGDEGGGEIIDAEADLGADAGGDGGAPATPDRPSKFAGTPESRPDDRDTVFVCPECGETWPTVHASLRPGDICPECHRGYLAEQVVQ